jgi:hypothetical protein
MREHFIRNGDVLTWITIVTDPVYLSEPHIRSRNFVLDPGYVMGAYPCTVEVETDHPVDYIPHYLPGSNPYLTEWAEKHHLPLEAAKGGPETMYPEYMLRLKSLSSAKSGSK